MPQHQELQLDWDTPQSWHLVGCKSTASSEYAAVIMCIVQRWKLHARQKNVTNRLNERFAIHCHCCGCFCKIEVCLSRAGCIHLLVKLEGVIGSIKENSHKIIGGKYLIVQRLRTETNQIISK
jgi:hypothetical protein